MGAVKVEHVGAEVKRRVVVVLQTLSLYLSTAGWGGAPLSKAAYYSPLMGTVAPGTALSISSARSLTKGRSPQSRLKVCQRLLGPETPGYFFESGKGFLHFFLYRHLISFFYIYFTSFFAYYFLSLWLSATGFFLSLKGWVILGVGKCVSQQLPARRRRRYAVDLALGLTV